MNKEKDTPSHILDTKGVALQALERIAVIRKYLSFFDGALQYVNNHITSYNEVIGEKDLRNRLVQLELEEWRNIAMWGLTLSEEDQDRIRAILYERFFAEKNGVKADVSRWWSDSFPPGSFLTATVEEFREMVRKVFFPRNSGEINKEDKEV